MFDRSGVIRCAIVSALMCAMSGLAISVAWAGEIPKKVKYDEARALAYLADRALHRDSELEDFAPGAFPPFIAFDGHVESPRGDTYPTSGAYAVNPWTGEVWDMWACKKVHTAALTKAQMDIRSRFSPTELRDYKKLSHLRAFCMVG